MIEDCRRPSRCSVPQLVMGHIPPSALRKKQPPPPRRRLLAPTTSKADGKISRGRRLPLYLRRCQKVNPSNSMIESLPDELLMEILFRLSADEISDNARLVCRRWCHLIHTNAFVYAHLQRASFGLLLNPPPSYNGSSPIFITATTQGRIEISESSFRVRFPILCSGNGLALCLREGAFRGGGMTPFILNPATKCAFNIPRFPVKLEDVDIACRSSMAYSVASMAYKVVGTFLMSGGVAYCAILTVGVDKTWRQVAVEGILSPNAMRIITDYYIPVVAGCFVHWVTRTHVLSLNVETETFTQTTPTPALMFPQEGENVHYPLSTPTGECLSLLISCTDWSWEVWEMKPETREWRKVLPNIDLEAHKCKIQLFAWEKDDVLKPVGWVRYPEVLAFFFGGKGRYCIIYNLDTEEIDSIELSTTANLHVVLQHRNSLVWSEKF